jgi:WD40 repeat protein
MAGTGKSTVALTIAREYAKKGRLGASFFFSRGGGDLASAGKFATTIAAQLAKELPELRTHVKNVVASQPRIRVVGLYEQWEKLVLEPLSRLGKNTYSRPIVIVVDALDECDNEDDVSLLIQCLVDAAAVGDIRLRVFVTSRPDPLINSGFNRISREAHQDFILHNIEHSVVDQDLTLFYQNRLRHTAERFRLSTSLYSVETIQILVRKSDRLFIHAATVCRFIHDGGQLAQERLSHLINMENQSTQPEKELYRMYTTVLEHSFALYREPEEAAKIRTLFNRVIGSIVVLSDTVTSAELSTILDEPEDNILPMLHCLYSVLDIPEEADRRIRLVHPSFRDFLLDPARSSNKTFSVDAKSTHRDLLFCCLRLMKAYLRRNMCNIQWPGTRTHDIPKARIDQLIAHPTQYACRNWIYHLQQSDVDPNEVLEIIDFFRSHFLFWLETLAWIGRLPEGITMIRLLGARIAPQSDAIDVQSMLSNMKLKWRQNLRLASPNTTPSLHQMVYDAMRFFLSNSSIIEEAPLQTYCSAILFSPEDSITRRMHINQLPQWISQRPITYKSWGSHLQTLVHSSSVIAVAFSPDGRLVASASANEVQFWNAATGKEQRTLRGHSGLVRAIVFAPDGRLLASAGDDKTVRLWDVATAKTHRILRGHLESVIAVAFSPDGRLIASTGRDKTVRLWDAATDKNHRILRGHSNRVTAIAFSPDGRLVASAGYDQTVRLWDVATGKNYRILRGHSNWVTAIAFSPDGQLIASTGDDKTLRLWDAATDKNHRILRGHSNSVEAIAFSPDGRLIASAGYDQTVRLWDVATGKNYRILQGHSNWVTAIAFSPDGQLIASAGDDKTVRLWDIVISKTQHMVQGYSGPIKAVAFSPNGQLVASLKTSDQTVWVWDVATGKIQRILRDHLEHVQAIAFSPDGRLMASAGIGKTIRLWNVATGEKQDIRQGHRAWVEAVAFSPDGQFVALHLGGIDKAVRLWDVATGEEQDILQSLSGSVTAIAFSPDGRLMASTAPAKDKTVRLWDVATGEEQVILQGLSISITAIAFSPDGRLVASTALAKDKTVRFWDVATGKEQRKLQIDTDLLYLSFSSCGSRLTTDRGTFLLSSAEPQPSENLSISGPWIQEGGRDILYLHPDYRLDLMFTAGNVVGFHGLEPSVLQIDASLSKSMIH